MLSKNLITCLPMQDLSRRDFEGMLSLTTMHAVVGMGKTRGRCNSWNSNDRETERTNSHIQPRYSLGCGGVCLPKPIHVKGRILKHACLTVYRRPAGAHCKKEVLLKTGFESKLESPNATRVLAMNIKASSGGGGRVCA
jgi:hypothetical protein